MMDKRIQKTANIILSAMRGNPDVIDTADGGEIHGELHNGTPVHFQASKGRIYVVIGDMGRQIYGSPEVSDSEAIEMVMRAARR